MRFLREREDWFLMMSGTRRSRIYMTRKHNFKAASILSASSLRIYYILNKFCFYVLSVILFLL